MTPASGALTVGDAGRADQKVTVSAAAGTKPDYYSAPFEPKRGWIQSFTGL
ncbi:hypothetical protein Airi01_100430 [Actinoallomurus iriomotensis]|uniref:Uncharacterized protein n=1 Tax=Actinoallomurus iriomotensis TaxID=478107 RepID=A0A9W6RSL6_9ACTN|nr:hypothetical protein Airi01_100430 [Actinoallomurus iriomotensis]